MKPLRIATRSSALALWQANWVADGLARQGLEAELVKVETQGDLDRRPFREMQGQAFFTKAVQDTVLAGDADLAVHSYKDLPSARHPGLAIAAVPIRAAAHDVLLNLPEAGEAGAPTLPIKDGARIGTSAARRRAQLLKLRPDLQALELRGNVETRIGKLRAGQYDAIILAAAGLERLGLKLGDLDVTPLPVGTFLPAPAQGALALECRSDDERIISALQALNHEETATTVAAERGLMARLDGGCQLALGAHARITGGTIQLSAWYDGQFVEGNAASVEEVIEQVYAQLPKDARPE